MYKITQIQTPAPNNGLKLDELPDVLIVAEVAEFLRLSTRTVYRLIEEGTLKASRYGRSVRVLKSELTSYLADD